MTDESTENRDRIDSLFTGIGVALVSLSAIVLVATLYLGVGFPTGDAVAPALLGTVVFSLFAVAVSRLTSRLTPDQSGWSQQFGR